ncbi:MAG TPA: hypothetical protein VI168_05960 [Croceibacterium sp.]
MTVPRRVLVVGGIAAALLAVVLANAHLVYVAMQSQPECIAHMKPGTSGETGAYSAARSSC